MHLTNKNNYNSYLWFYLLYTMTGEDLRRTYNYNHNSTIPYTLKIEYPLDEFEIDV